MHSLCSTSCTNHAAVVEWLGVSVELKGLGAKFRSYKLRPDGREGAEVLSAVG